MVKRQPGRPSEQEVMAAAVRYTRDEYSDDTIVAMHGDFASAYYLLKLNRKSADIATLRKEQAAEGLPGIPETLEKFAIRLLSTKLRNNE